MIMMVIVGAILVASLFFIKSKTSVIELKSKENELTQLRMYTNEIESMQQEIRKFKHDYMNILASLSGYIEQNNMAGLKKYFDEKIMTFSVQKDSIDKTVDRLIYVEQEELKGLLAMKVIRAQEAGVKVEIDMVEKVKFHMDIVDLCRIVGIFVDNAIEAAALSTEKTIAIGMVNVDEKALLIVTNTVAEMVPIYKLREKGFTTKGNNHGLGLEIVRGILKSYPNVNNDMKFENQMFTQVLEVRVEH
jgi:two-component system sensor histidine kinase AgrC